MSTSRFTRVTKKRRNACQCGAIRRDDHHPSCPNNPVFCSCGSRWDVGHVCEEAK